MSTRTEPQPSTQTRPDRGWFGWALVGVAAGALTLGVAEFIAGVMVRFGWIGGTGSPVLAVGETFIDHTPAWLKTFAVNVFGTADKVALLTGMAIVLTALAAGVGVLMARRPTAAFVAFVVLLAVALAAVLTRPGASGTDAVPTLLGGGLGLALLHACRARLQPAADQVAPDRRTVLQLSAVSLVGAGIAALAGQAVSGTTRAVAAARSAFKVPTPVSKVRIPADASVRVAGVVPFVVPADQFYRIDTALSPPEVDPATWSLKVTGMVEREVTLTWAELIAKPLQEAVVTLMCVSNEVGGDLTGNAVWTGWPVRDLLALAGPKAGADMVLSTSTDGWTAGTPLTALTDGRNALLAVGMNGEPLPVDHGFPVRMVVPGLYGYVSATKWVTELKVTTYADDQGYWTPRGWSAKGPVKTGSRIDVPADGATVSAGKVAVAGIAWRQHVGIKGVQVRIDDGPWVDARLAADATVDAWRQWVYEWDASAGSHQIAVRATDGDGTVQTSALAPPAPDGATGWHTINVTVT
ncbi:molybdopterin-dependent oxidoreductase [Branchiibius sp. NY16-3462-2]|uniref:molybdopterin-dependent oxidoreductase n=1 Tax=Branchiibius sp. NY16-3462-2 TaxID=1807500 RepID=UPI000794A2C1|nr:molybdopterin-dependent oxidoreductase [Branchiibius sp. NY16-3462-2]KYH45758.1 oxidoreductase [Branchiibius sp. NY16-3462-2]